VAQVILRLFYFTSSQEAINLLGFTRSGDSPP
jgi:hypothetical protein